MTFFAAAIIGTATVGSALIGANASKKAAQAQQQASTDNNALQRQIYDANTANLSPWMARGNAAGVNYNALLGIGDNPAALAAARHGFNDYLGNTDYGYQQQQALRNIQASYAAHGLNQSGAAMKALQDRYQNINQSYFGQYLDRLNGVSNQGFGAGSAIAGVGQGYAGAVGANNNAAADATGNAALAGAGIASNALNGMATYTANRMGQSSFGKVPSSAYSGGSITNWASGLPNQTPIKGF